MKIGIFGGTFNPIHYGHLRVAEEVLEILAFDKIWFIPSGTPPFSKPDIVSASHRYEMTKIAIKNNPGFDVSDVEVKTRGISYSVKTMERLTLKHKETEFFFILGIDTFLDIPKWRQPSRLMKLANTVVISRPGFSFLDLCISPYLAGIQKKTLREVDRGKRKIFSFNLKTGRKLFLCRVSELEISASAIRDFVRSGKSIKYLLPDSVESYIISHKLYTKK